MNIDKETCEKYGGMWFDNDEYYGENACVGIDLSFANLPEAKLIGINLYDSNLHFANLSDSYLKAVKLNEESVKSLLEIKPTIWYSKEDKEQIKKNKELIKKELLLSGV